MLGPAASDADPEVARNAGHPEAAAWLVSRAP
jgi:hypothetical protein